MKDPEYRATYEAEERKEKLQALLAEWRHNAGITRAQVAERMGVKPPTVSRMESNINKASIDTLARYARACGVEKLQITL
ncbi:helix-turn-helix domain-containing protein [Photorhabdus stackebrandtii]|uniref:XRE family transcriptional regulator n=1 Tax=Photorhabdus stackebrandtii TaxID=1123042 RepID=A0A7X5QPH5_9GAMM|nr:helix-turn-helix transcriptional regulator [Photorhabdus stackebrandtii]NHB97962.1 XRE family transcriptional regulator [Photorhabdus stackebrandtii]